MNTLNPDQNNGYYRNDSARAKWWNYGGGIYHVIIKTKYNTHYFGQIIHNSHTHQNNMIFSKMGNYANELQQTEWCAVNIPQTVPAHTLIVDYTAGQNNQFGVRNIDYLAVDEDNRLYVYYSDSDEPYYLTKINGLKRNGIRITVVKIKNKVKKKLFKK